MTCCVNRSRRTSPLVAALWLLSGVLLSAGRAEAAQGTVGRIVSKHVLVRIPAEREWLGQDTIADLERCYVFIDKTTGGGLPGRVLATFAWDDRQSAILPEEAGIIVSMNDAAAQADSRSYLLHNATKEMARLALFNLSKGGAWRAENRFLLEGMAEFLTREYEHESRGLNAAWVRCHFMDRIEPLSLSALASWEKFSGGSQDQRAASPGITFLLACREVSNRERMLKLFQAMRSKSLPESLAEAFKTPAETLESMWLEKVRAYQVTEDFTVASDEEAPKLERIVLDPEAGIPGQELGIRLFARDRSNDLRAATVFLEEPESKLVLSGQTPGATAAKYILFRVPVARDRKPGRYDYRMVAVDETGNVRIWPGSYPVAPK